MDWHHPQTRRGGGGGLLNSMYYHYNAWQALYSRSNMLFKNVLKSTHEAIS